MFEGALARKDHRHLRLRLITGHDHLGVAQRTAGLGNGRHALGHGGVRGNPCLFPARFFPELLELREDHGGNTVIRRHEEELFLLEVPAEELHDVDTVQALEELKAEAAR